MISSRLQWIFPPLHGQYSIDRLILHRLLDVPSACLITIFQSAGQTLQTRLPIRTLTSSFTSNERIQEPKIIQLAFLRQ